MHGFEIRRWARVLAAGSALLLAAACGGGDNVLVGDYYLFSVGKILLPADLTFDQCDPARVFGGSLWMNADGTWKFRRASSSPYQERIGHAGVRERHQLERRPHWAQAACPKSPAFWAS